MEKVVNSTSYGETTVPASSILYGNFEDHVVDDVSIIRFEYSPVLVGVSCGCILLIIICIFLWNYFKTTPSERFDESFSCTIQAYEISQNNCCLSPTETRKFSEAFEKITEEDRLDQNDMV